MWLLAYHGRDPISKIDGKEVLSTAEPKALKDSHSTKVTSQMWRAHLILRKMLSKFSQRAQVLSMFDEMRGMGH